MKKIQTLTRVMELAKAVNSGLSIKPQRMYDTYDYEFLKSRQGTYAETNAGKLFYNIKLNVYIDDRKAYKRIVAKGRNTYQDIDKARRAKTKKVNDLRYANSLLELSEKELDDILKDTQELRLDIIDEIIKSNPDLLLTYFKRRKERLDSEDAVLDKIVGVKKPHIEAYKKRRAEIKQLEKITTSESYLLFNKIKEAMKVRRVNNLHIV